MLVQTKRGIILVSIPDVDPKTGHNVGYFTLICDKYGCELVDMANTKLAKFTAKHGVEGQIAKVRGLAVTQMPTENHFIPKTTFNDMLKNPESSLVGKPIADRHGEWPWDEISVSETLGVVTKAWYSDEYESLLFEAEIWDPKAINSIKAGTQKQFSIAYYYDFKFKNKRDWYDDLQTMAHVTWMETNHLALLSDPQVIEAELLEDLQILGKSGCVKLQKEYGHNSILFGGEAPTWGGIDKTRLPFEAFVFEIGEKGKKSTYKYPHHWVTRGEMFLHRQGLAYALAAAKGARSGKQASPEVLAHLNNHLKEISSSQEELLLEFKEYLEQFDYPIDEIIEWYGSDDYLKVIGETPMGNEEESTEQESPVDSTEEPTVEAHSEESTEAETVEETIEDAPVVEEPVVEEPPVEEPVVEEPPVEEPVVEEPVVEEPVEGEGEEELSTSEEELDVAPISLQVKNLEAEANDYKLKYEAMKLERDAALKKQMELEDKIKFSDVEKRVDELIRLGRFTPVKKDSLVSLFKSMTPEQIKSFEALSEDKGVSFEEMGIDKPEPEETPQETPKKKKFRKELPGYVEDEKWQLKLG